MISEYYCIRNKYNLSDLVKISMVHIDTQKKVWLTEHHHTEIELGLYLSGRGSYKTATATIPFQPGDILLFRSNEEHIITNIDYTENIAIMNFHLDPRLLWWDGAQSVSQNGLHYFLSQEDSITNRYPSGSQENTTLRSLIRDIEEELEGQKPEFELMVKLKLLNMLVEITRSSDAYVQKHSFVSDISMQHLSCLEKVIDYILNNLSEELTLTQLAGKANMSRSYLSALFKEMNGLSIWDFIIIKRVELALKYLTETNDPITHIAGSCGFNSTANFNRAFKKITQQSPSEFRKNRRNSF